MTRKGFATGQIMVVLVINADAIQAEEDLAEELGVTRQTVIAIENNKYDPTLELAMKISEFFGLSVNDIFHLK